jgi:catechol 2,3-dioxygenase-like lactoylglutathione lyase family enzyme
MPLKPSDRSQHSNTKRWAPDSQVRFRSTGTLACALFAFLLAVLAASAAQFPLKKHAPPKRPRILGIAGVTILVPDIEAAHRYYRTLIDPDHACEYCDNGSPNFLFLPSGQRIEFKKIPSPAPADLLEEVSFLTDDLDAFGKYLSFHKIGYDEIKRKHTGDVFALQFDDPEKHHLSVTDSFHVTRGDGFTAGLPPRPPFSFIRIIHAGFVVNSRELINHFYVDLLGFRPYWHGGMTDDKDDWVAMQVPDGTDWLEDMLNIPSNADKQTLGVMNHISLGVPSVRVVAYDLARVGVKTSEKPQIGRDGKWQLNVYDASLTRIEFMEFKPVQKPCCSDFTGPHPEPAHPEPAPPIPTQP